MDSEEFPHEEFPQTAGGSFNSSEVRDPVRSTHFFGGKSAKAHPFQPFRPVFSSRFTPFKIRHIPEKNDGKNLFSDEHGTSNPKFSAKFELLEAGPVGLWAAMLLAQKAQTTFGDGNLLVDLEEKIDPHEFVFFCGF